MTQTIIDQMREEAERVAGRFVGDDLSPVSRLAYARGVRDMASLLMACANAAQELCDEETEGTPAHTMLRGYANGLRHIAEGADGLIPPGYEY